MQVTQDTQGGIAHACASHVFSKMKREMPQLQFQMTERGPITVTHWQTGQPPPNVLHAFLGWWSKTLSHWFLSLMILLPEQKSVSCVYRLWLWPYSAPQMGELSWFSPELVGTEKNEGRAQGSLRPMSWARHRATGRGRPTPRTKRERQWLQGHTEMTRLLGQGNHLMILFRAGPRGCWLWKECGCNLKTLKKIKKPFSEFSSSFTFFLTQTLRLKCTFLNTQINETEKSTDSSSQRSYYVHFRNRPSGGFYVNKWYKTFCLMPYHLLSDVFDQVRWPIWVILQMTVPRYLMFFSFKSRPPKKKKTKTSNFAHQDSARRSLLESFIFLLQTDFKDEEMVTTL